MLGFADTYLRSLKEVDGFILKYRSPSCGISNVKVYPSTGKVGALSSKAKGMFANEVINRFPNIPTEDEGRLKNFRIREHFLTGLFAVSRFRVAKQLKSMKALVQFHSENKYLLMAYNQKELKILGRIVANPGKRSPQELLDDYGEHFLMALSRTPRYTSNINVLMHTLGYFSKSLSHHERSFFLETIERYRSSRIPLSVPLNIVRSWIVRFEEPYLSQQTFFDPYPGDLIEVTDSGKGRDV
jgi:uncharacterized protein YbgA (DUF1722 family)